MVTYVAGTGPLGKFQHMLFDLAVVTKNRTSNFITKATDWITDRVNAAKPIFESIKNKVMAMWTKVTTWIKGLFE